MTQPSGLSHLMAGTHTPGKVLPAPSRGAVHPCHFLLIIYLPGTHEPGLCFFLEVTEMLYDIKLIPRSHDTFGQEVTPYSKFHLK